MADMIKFYKGLVEQLPASGANGALYITTDEGAIYLGTGTGMKRLGDFVQVDNVASLPAKAHESCLYYCVAENILAKWNGTEWKQINKQPTAEEMKTLLGLGSMAYVSEVSESNLSTELAEKVNASAEGNHAHANKTVLDGITAEKVAAWDSAEADAIAHADGLNTDMNTRVEALEAVDHEHANKALLDTYTQTEANLADAVAKKHAHTFNETELNKIVEGDVAKWNGVAADHLTSADKTTLENAIKDAKKAGTDANTNIEAYKVTNDARVLAVEEDIAEITNAENGVLAQAKAYSDGKLATARTEITAEIDADVKVVADDLAGYKTSNDAALAGVKATAEAAAVKTEVETALAGKVDKVEGKDLIATSEIERLATLHNYDDTAVRADIAKKADAETMTTELGKKVDKVEGYSLVADTEIARLANVDNYDDTALAGRVTTAEGKITALEGASATHATKAEVEAVDAKFADYNTTVAQKAIDDAQDARIKAIEDDYLVEADKTALTEAITAETTRATGVEAGFETRIKAIEDDYLKAADKTELANAVNAEKERAEGVEAGLRTDVDALVGKVGEVPADKTVVQMIADAQTAATYDDTQVKADIAANTKAIADETTRAEAAEAGLDARLVEVETFFKTAEGETISDALDTLVEIQKYITEDGLAGDQMVKDIAANKAAIEAEVARATAAEEANAKAIADQATADAATYETKTDAAAKLTEAKEYADGLNTAMDTRVKVLEAIDHDAYVAADATLKAEVIGTAEDASTADTINGAKKYAEEKATAAQTAAEATAAGALATAKTELEGKITDGDAATLAAAKEDAAAKVKELAEGAVATNATNIAALLEQLTWGSFAE